MNKLLLASLLSVAVIPTQTLPTITATQQLMNEAAKAGMSLTDYIASQTQTVVAPAAPTLAQNIAPAVASTFAQNAKNVAMQTASSVSQAATNAVAYVISKTPTPVIKLGKSGVAYAQTVAQTVSEKAAEHPKVVRAVAYAGLALVTAKIVHKVFFASKKQVEPVQKQDSIHFLEASIEQDIADRDAADEVAAQDEVVDQIANDALIAAELDQEEAARVV